MVKFITQAHLQSIRITTAHVNYCCSHYVDNGLQNRFIFAQEPLSSEVTAEAHTKWYSVNSTTQICTSAMYKLWLACEAMIKKKENKTKMKTTNTTTVRRLTLNRKLDHNFGSDVVSHKG
jgi:hypothetical protein